MYQLSGRTLLIVVVVALLGTLLASVTLVEAFVRGWAPMGEVVELGDEVKIEKTFYLYYKKGAEYVYPPSSTFLEVEHKWNHPDDVDVWDDSVWAGESSYRKCENVPCGCRVAKQVCTGRGWGKVSLEIPRLTATVDRVQVKVSSSDKPSNAVDLRKDRQLKIVSYCVPSTGLESALARGWWILVSLSGILWLFVLVVAVKELGGRWMI